MKDSKGLRGQLFRACSVLALSGFASAAHAACAPDPTIAFGMTTCTGTDGNGIVVSTNGTQVNVAAGALVQPGSGAASITLTNNSGVVVNGTVDGGSVAGLMATNGTPYYAYVYRDPYTGASVPVDPPFVSGGYQWIYPGTSASLIVNEGGVLTGATAVHLVQRSDNASGSVSLELHNSGTIAGTDGAAIVAASGTSVSSLSNMETGTIGAIAGTVSGVFNAGLIDGGSLSAIANSAPYSFYTNTGSIRSSSTAATLSLVGGTIDNSGTIANEGTGPALSSTDLLTIRNEGSGIVASAGTIAILASGGLYVTNAGTISGSLDARASSAGSTIDTSAGSIDGDVLLGSGDDLLLAGAYEVATGHFANISGDVDGGGGIDTVRLAMDGDATLDAVSVPGNFERFQLALENDAIVTLAQGLDLSHGLSFGGSGSLVNEADLTTTGPAISAIYISPSAPRFTNSGNISAALTSSDQYALTLGHLIEGQNSGSVTAARGNGVSVGMYSSADAFTNEGAITASGTGISIAGKLDNQGTIRSTGGVAVINSLGGGVIRSITSTNSGTIEGSTAGVRIDTINFANTGTMTAANGMGVDLGYYAGFDNQAGGVVGGNGTAIGISGFGYNLVVQNAGTVNGDVNLVPRNGYDFSDDVFVDNGGTVNGDLFLGGGNDFLITDIDRAGALAGVTGTVDAGAGYDTIRYRASSDASAMLSTAVPASFEAIGYEVANGAALSLGSESPLALSLSLAGEGSIDLDADLSQTDHVIIDIAALNTAQITGTGTSAGSDLAVISHGDLALTVTEPYTYHAYSAVSAGTGDFENAGTIAVTGATGVYYTPTAISGGSVVTNSGTITLDGAMAASGAMKFVNTGEILQKAGGAGSNGIFAAEVENSGTISVGGTAVGGTYYNSISLTNSGNIASTDGVAVISSFGSMIDNLASGMIAGGAGTAIQIDGGTVRNAGIIEGNVNLDYQPIAYLSGSYIAAGGMLDGDLQFGSGNDSLIETGSDFGVTGAIDGGAGFDLVGHQLSQSGTITLGGAFPLNFEGEFTAAVGSDTVATIAADGPIDENIYVAGDGQIVNQVATSGKVQNISDVGTYVPDLYGQLAAFSNQADIARGISLATASLSNDAAVGSASLTTSAVYQIATGTLSFNNSGMLQTQGSYTARLYGGELTSASITNSGTISGGATLISLIFGEASPAPSGAVTNSGTIRGPDGLYIEAYYPADPTDFSLEVINSGTVEATAAGGTALTTVTFGAPAISIINSGVIRANSGGTVQTVTYLDFDYGYRSVETTSPAAAIEHASPVGPETITNTEAGLIEATGTLSTAIRSNAPLTLVNAGTINGTAGYTVDPADYSAQQFGITAFAGAVQTFGEGADTIENSSTINGSIHLAPGNDSIVNTGSISGNVDLGGGNDRFVQRLSAALGGLVDGGDDDDMLLVDITGGGTLDSAFYAPFLNFESFGLAGAGSIAADGTLPVQTLLLDAGATFELAEGSTLQTLGPVAITGSGGADHIVNRGTIIGDVALGGGDDSFTVLAGSSLTGSVDGGSGTDRLSLRPDGSAASPAPIDLAPYSAFEQLALESGVGSLSGSASFDRIAVNAGRLIGLAGSNISATQGITVAPGATFGSAGTVNGSAVVGGTLSPGASPGTMTVNGDVTLASGSTTLFEMTPPLSDALVISGSLGIEEGARLEITGSRPLTPGVTYELITATGGISGSFSTIDKVDTVLGFLRQTADAIELLGTLQLHGGANPLAAATTDYVNGLLIDAAATTGIYNALPLLVDAAGYADTAAIATLHPEAYASAAQIGVDNGLAVASALRGTHQVGEGRGPGFYAIGQGLGSWHDLGGDAAAGTSDARQNTGGFLGGIGYQAGPLAVTVFAGRIHASQNIKAIGARTEAEGTFAGGSLTFMSAGLDVSGSIIWDGSSAETHRLLFDGNEANARYDLHSLTMAGHAGYSFALGNSGWRLGPELGLAHVRVRRRAAQETGGGAFSLEVAGRSEKATFLNADLRLDMARSEPLRPWLSAGWQHRIDGEPALATANFSGVTDQFTVAGAERDKDFAHVGGGFDWSAAPNLVFFARGNIAFNGSTGTQSVNAGLRMGF